MRHEFVNPFAQRALAKEDHALQAGFLDAAYESLSVGVQVRRSRRQFHRLYTCSGKHIQELSREQWVAVVNEVPLPTQNSLICSGEIPGDLAHP